jgi:hypothetical protein
MLTTPPICVFQRVLFCRTHGAKIQLGIVSRHARQALNTLQRECALIFVLFI